MTPGFRREAWFRAVVDAARSRVAPSARIITLAGLLIVATPGCRDTPTTPTVTADTPVITPQSVSFPGVVGAGGSVSRAFNAQLPGTARAALSGISPPTSLVVGLGIPRVDGTGCLLAHSTTAVDGGAAEVSGAVAAGTFCVQVFAPGRAADEVRFTVALEHP